MKLLRQPFWLFVLVFTACATPTPSVTTTTPFNLVVPTPLTSDILLENGRSDQEPSTLAPLPTVSPTRQLANSWQTYRDPIHDVGLAYPVHWQQTVAGEMLILRNGEETAVQACTPPQPFIELSFTSFAVPATETTTDWLYTHLSNQNRIVASVEQGYTGNYPSLIASATPQDPTSAQQPIAERIVRLTPDTLLLIQLNAPESQTQSDVLAIFDSLAAPNQPITIPAAPPSLCK